MGKYGKKTTKYTISIFIFKFIMTENQFLSYIEYSTTIIIEY